MLESRSLDRFAEPRHTFCSHLAMKGAGAGDSRDRGSSRSDDDAKLRAPQSECGRGCDSMADGPGARGDIVETGSAVAATN